MPTRSGPGGAVPPAAELQTPLAVTMGDPAGIGLDIMATAWADATRPGGRPLPPLVLIGDPAALEARAGALGIALELAIVDAIPAADALEPGHLAVLPVRATQPVVAGRPDSANASAVIGSIERAVAETMAGRAAAVVTNPISKATLYAAGFPHPGHTEFLGVLADAHRPGRTWTPVMMLASDALRVVPLTVHIPLADVPAAVTTERLLDVCRITAADLASRFGIHRPRIAVAGLNPHAGEGGSIGREEVATIAPAIETLRREGLDITGPHSADTLFHAAARARYDVAVCMYHDQALIPIKTIAFDTGVNVTLGLPFVRTSPDHGTAFDIAGTGRADAQSLVAAIHMAARMAESSGGEARAGKARS